MSLRSTSIWCPRWKTSKAKQAFMRPCWCCRCSSGSVNVPMLLPSSNNKFLTIVDFAMLDSFALRCSIIGWPSSWIIVHVRCKRCRNRASCLPWSFRMFFQAAPRPSSMLHRGELSGPGKPVLSPEQRGRMWQPSISLVRIIQARLHTSSLDLSFLLSLATSE